MIDLSKIHEKRLAMIAWGEKIGGADEVSLFCGVAKWDGFELTMLREPKGKHFVVSSEWYERIKPVAVHLRTILLNAEYYFSVSVGNLGVNEDASSLYDTGLNWLQEENTD
jgi:hypothetical protein